MSNSGPAPEDVETIAALIDRRLPEEERRQFLERLDREPALYEVFVETVRYREATRGGRGQVVALPERRTARRWALPGAVAALLAAAVATPLLLLSGGSLSSAGLARSLVAQQRLEPHLGAGWFEPEWARLRGVGFAGAEEDAAFRVGVSDVDLEIALRAAQPEAAAALAYRLEALLRGIDLSEPLQATYAAVGRHLDEGAPLEQALALTADTDRHFESYLPELAHAYELGKWAEAGRLAALSGNTSLLRSRRFSRALDEARERQWTEAVTTRLEAIGEQLRLPAREMDLERLQASFRAILEEG